MANRREALKGAMKFFDGDELAARVWVDKYALKDQDGDFKETSPEHMHDRLLQHFPGDADVSEAIREGWFIPAGRILFAMGNPFVKATQLNCYVIPIKRDSLEGIFECAKEMARTYSYGGGCGIDIGSLRPSGSLVNNTAITSSGSVSFMDFFSKVTGTVGQHGRRGALMITIPVDHPDAPQFLNIKDDLDPSAMSLAGEDLRNYIYNRRAVGHANISIKLTDEFLEAVEKGEDFRLRWESADGQIKSESMVDARQYWKGICHQAWKQAEPGLLFWDRMVEESPSDQYDAGGIHTTNPCFTGEMRLHTSQGMLSFSELNKSGRSNLVVTDRRADGCEKGVSLLSATRVTMTARNQKIYKLTTKHGHEIRCTAYHKFPTPEGRKQLNDLRPGDTLLLQSGEGGWGAQGNYDDGLILGSLTGDGNISWKKKGGPLHISLEFWNEPDMAARLETIVKRRVAGLSRSPAVSTVGLAEVPSRQKQSICSVMLYRYMHDRYGTDRDSKKRVPECVWQGSRDFVRGYLASLFQADGSVHLGGRGKKQTLSVRLSQSNPELLGDVQTLLGNFGIVSSVYLRRKAQKKLLPDGKGGHKLYRCKPQHELIVNRPNSLVFERSIGFAGNKQRSLKSAFDACGRKCQKPERFVTNVESIEPDGVEDVYCLTEPKTHSIVVNGVVASNCGEQPLPPYDSCNLGSINLRHMVDDPWTRKSTVNWDRLSLTVRAAVTFLDRVRTIETEENRFPLPEQQEASERFRRIGLGVMGFGEMVASLGITYGGEGFQEFSESLFERIRDEAYKRSSELARELGPFPAFDWERHSKCPFVRRLPKRILDSIAEHGLRNITIVSFAPTGSIAILGQTSGGIEPMFAPLYKRYSNLGGIDRMEFRVYDPAVSRWQQATGAEFPTDPAGITPDVLDTLPPFFVFSHNVPWEARVDVQGAAQRFVDSSISSTINLPSDVTEEEVAAIYMRGWKAGCKGVTVYREGCRENILETVVQDEEPEAREISRPWDRPTVMDCRSMSFKSHENRVLIDFCQDAQHDLKEVKVVMGRSGDEAHALCEALGRCVSKLLQKGTDVAEIAESLRGIKSGETQWLRFDDEQEHPYVVRSVPDAMSAYMYHAYVLPAREAAMRETTTTTAPTDAMAVDEAKRAGSCPQCEGVDEYGRR